ncbi:MAG: hypothetical protein ABI934_08520 [Actinomycetota bacterium]
MVLPTIRAHVRLFVAAGVLAVFVTVALIFGVRVEISRSAAQPQLIANTTNGSIAGAPVKSTVVPAVVPTKAPKLAR